VLARLHGTTEFLRPWQPLRPDAWFTEADSAQRPRTRSPSRLRAPASHWSSYDRRGEVAGAITLASVIRGAFQSCSVGYWLAEPATARAVATDALREATGSRSES
jgi:ribosomal-protein-alanine N-acetyltransferase